ncbi:MAG: alpha-glucan family phosphorylase, partial [Acidimicrobiia bacterium]|nr:alpha-glucan family phosphorylase [Acidimicrobiia bacterium]
MDTHSLRAALLAQARNHSWTWSTEARDTFAVLPTSTSGTHPATAVGALTDAQLDTLLADEPFVERVRAGTATVSALTEQIPDAPDIAYFSPEFGITDLVPQYSGGLGILAGDHLKAASDLSISLCAVGLFYREGFFRQGVSGGGQIERYERYDAIDLGCVDTGIRIGVPIGDHDVSARVWRLDVGRIALVLLDTDVPTNDRHDSAITDRLYSGDRRHRLEQELVLGVGGARALARLGWSTPVTHLNEGHAGFLVLELLDREIQAGKTLAEALDAVRPGLVFTTHTPVPAGIDRFEPHLTSTYLAPWADRWGLAIDDLLDLGRDPDDDPPAFNMAALCLKSAGRANGVSQLHGAVSRDLFAGIPGGDRIGSITNGVHARTWVMPRLQDAFDATLGTGWADGDACSWQHVDALDDGTIRAIRLAGSDDLRALVADRTGARIDPDSLIVGFARRFATYKRATLLLQHPAELEALLADARRPITFVFAGKAHP